jgi:multisubunit Na+/H+ antiporter MnhB subunit
MSKLSKAVTTEHTRLAVIALLIPVVSILLTGLCFFIMDQLFKEIPDGVRSAVAVFCFFAACFAALCAGLPGSAEDTDE